MRKQMRAATSLLFMSIASLSYVGCTSANHTSDDHYYVSSSSEVTQSRPVPITYGPTYPAECLRNAPVCMSTRCREAALARSQQYYQAEPGMSTTVVKSSESYKTVAEPGFAKSTSVSDYSKTVSESSRTTTSNVNKNSQIASDASNVSKTVASAYTQTANQAQTTAKAANNVAVHSDSKVASHAVHTTDSTVGHTSHQVAQPVQTVSQTKTQTTSHVVQNSGNVAGQNHQVAQPVQNAVKDTAVHTVQTANHTVTQTTSNVAQNAGNAAGHPSHHVAQPVQHAANHAAQAAHHAAHTVQKESHSTTTQTTSHVAQHAAPAQAAPVKATYASNTRAETTRVVNTNQNMNSNQNMNPNQNRNWNERNAQANSNNYAQNSGSYTTVNNHDNSRTVVAPAKGCKYASNCDLTTGVTVRARNPRMCHLTGQYAIDYEVQAAAEVHDVVLTATLSDGITYVSSQPEAKVSGHQLTWKIDRMNRGQSLVGKINLKADKEGELCTCFNVVAAADGCCSIMCAKPQLTSDKSGPEEVAVGNTVNYMVTVANTGNYPAEDVVLVIRDVQQNQAEPFTAKLGTIDINQAKKVNYSVLASKRGKLAYKAVATSSNANQTGVDLNTNVFACSVDCLKNGPKEAYIGQLADYQITVVNSGDKTLHDIIITDTVHPATKIIKAKDATITDRKAEWKIKELKPGEKTAYTVSLTSRAPGNYTNSTLVTEREGFNATRDTTTHWKGRAALDVSMSTSDNSIFVDETTRYKITVTNQGQEPDSNVVVTVDFPSELEPINSSGDTTGKISGQRVTFAPAGLGLRQTLEYYVTVKAHGHGDLRPKLHVSSDAIKSPVTQEESLIVN